MNKESILTRGEVPPGQWRITHGMSSTTRAVDEPEIEQQKQHPKSSTMFRRSLTECARQLELVHYGGQPRIESIGIIKTGFQTAYAKN